MGAYICVGHVWVELIHTSAGQEKESGGMLVHLLRPAHVGGDIDGAPSILFRRPDAHSCKPAHVADGGQEDGLGRWHVEWKLALGHDAGTGVPAGREGRGREAYGRQGARGGVEETENEATAPTAASGAGRESGMGEGVGWQPGGLGLGVGAAQGSRTNAAFRRGGREAAGGRCRAAGVEAILICGILHKERQGRGRGALEASAFLFQNSSMKRLARRTVHGSCVCARKIASTWCFWAIRSTRGHALVCAAELYTSKRTVPHATAAAARERARSISAVSSLCVSSAVLWQ